MTGSVVAVENGVVLGLGDTGPARLLRRIRDRAAGATAWQRRPPTGGPPWAYDHHIDVDERVGP